MINDISSAVLTLLWRSSWQTGVLLLVIWPLSRLSRHHNPKFAYGLWALLLVKSLLPFNFPLAFASTDILQSSAHFITSLPSIFVTQQHDPRSIYPLLLAGTWLTVVLFLAFKLILDESRLRRELRTATEWHPTDQIRQLMVNLNLKHKPVIFLTERINIPFTLGVWRPRIYLPPDALDWSGGEQLGVLAHELTHIKRYDLMVIYLQALVRVVYFFNPVVWLMNGRLDLARERICDDEAIRATASNRLTYGRSLLNQLEKSVQSPVQPVLASSFFMSRQQLVQRFEYIIQYQSNERNGLNMYHKLLWGVAIVATLAVSCQMSGESNSAELTAADEMTGKAADADTPVVVTYDIPPKPIGGYAAIQENMVYPELARKAGIEGTVVIQTKITTAGAAENCKIVRGIGEGGLNEAAITAIEKTRWEPASQDNKPVEVWISIPVVFKLDNAPK